MLSSLASILIAAAAALLKVLLQQRQATQDAHDVGRLTGVVQSLEAANVALRYKAEAAADPVAASTLRVRTDVGTIELPGDNPDADTPPKSS